MLSWIDVFAVIFLAFFAYQGAQRGVVRILMDIIAVLLAIFASSSSYAFLTSTIMPFMRTPDKAGYVITFIILFIFFVLALDMLAGIIQKLVKVTFHGMLEGLGGGVLGFMKGVLLIGVIIQLFSLYPFLPQIGDSVNNSMSKKLALPTLRKTYSSLFAMFPRIDFFIQEKVIPATPQDVPKGPIR
jgi:membrane protein required for colicin V production